MASKQSQPSQQFKLKFSQASVKRVLFTQNYSQGSSHSKRESQEARTDGEGIKRFLQSKHSPLVGRKKDILL
jgi:hypothetical protein